MFSRACATGHIKDPVSLIEKGRGLSPGGRFPPGFIHRVNIITEVIRLYVLALKMRWHQMPTGRKTPTISLLLTTDNDKGFILILFIITRS